MRTSYFSHAVLISCLSALFAFSSATALAQSSDKPAPPPPKMDKLEEGTDPNLKGTEGALIKPKEGNKITERKVNGKVVEAKVKIGKSNYIMKPNEEHGNAQPGDVQSNSVHGTQWSVLEFGGDKNKEKDKAQDSSQPAKAAASSSASSK
ncbi:MAG: hypothetical protein HYZ45_02525 [Burkholderiales bacterium]|nr:hypothetical protein [Burkholderiales bacterium]